MDAAGRDHRCPLCVLFPMGLAGDVLCTPSSARLNTSLDCIDGSCMSHMSVCAPAAGAHRVLVPAPSQHSRQICPPSILLFLTTLSIWALMTDERCLLSHQPWG